MLSRAKRPTLLVGRDGNSWKPGAQAGVVDAFGIKLGLPVVDALVTMSYRNFPRCSISIMPGPFQAWRPPWVKRAST